MSSLAEIVPVAGPVNCVPISSVNCVPISSVHQFVIESKEYKKLETEKEKLETEKKKLETEKKKLETEKKKLKKKNDELGTENVGLEGDCKILDNGLVELETEKEKLEKENVELGKDRDYLGDQLDVSKQALSAQKEQLKALQAKTLNVLEIRKQHLSEMAKNLKQSKQNLKQSKLRQEKKKEKLESLIKVYQAEILELKVKVVKQIKISTELKRSLGKQRDELTEQGDELTDAKKYSEHMKIKLDESDKELYRQLEVARDLRYTIINIIAKIEQIKNVTVQVGEILEETKNVQ